jgi:hypothetical protein
MILNKKGQGLSVSTVILIVLGLLVLVITAVIVTGGFRDFTEKIGLVKSTTFSFDEARLKCQAWCDERDKEKFCTQTFYVDEDRNVYDYPPTGLVTEYRCSSESVGGTTGDNFGVKCPYITLKDCEKYGRKVWIAKSMNSL